MQADEKVVLDRDAVERALTRIAREIAERNSDAPQPPALLGIHRRGVLIAERLLPALGELLGEEVPGGALEVAYYRDDLGRRPHAPTVNSTRLDVSIDGRTVVIVDDVLFTGRTVRAAIDALFGYGRPARVQLAVLVDRGHRELPVRPDYVGKNLPTSLGERVNVRLRELDGSDEVTIMRMPSEGVAA